MFTIFPRAISVALTFVVGSAAAVNLSCYQNERTDAVQCIDAKKVVEKGGIRSSALWTGGPKDVNKTRFTVHVNCASNVMHMKDYQGVSFAGASASETPASQRLRDIICEAKLPSANGKK